MTVAVAGKICEIVHFTVLMLLIVNPFKQYASIGWRLIALYTNKIRPMDRISLAKLNKIPYDFFCNLDIPNPLHNIVILNAYIWNKN